MAFNQRANAVLVRLIKPAFGDNQIPDPWVSPRYVPTQFCWSRFWWKVQYSCWRSLDDLRHCLRRIHCESLPRIKMAWFWFPLTFGAQRLIACTLCGQETFTLSFSQWVLSWVTSVSTSFFPDHHNTYPPLQSSWALALRWRIRHLVSAMIQNIMLNLGMMCESSRLNSHLESCEYWYATSLVCDHAEHNRIGLISYRIWSVRRKTADSRVGADSLAGLISSLDYRD